MRHLHRQEYPSVITEGEKRREQREERGSGGTKTHTSRGQQGDRAGHAGQKHRSASGRDRQRCHNLPFGPCQEPRSVTKWGLGGRVGREQELLLLPKPAVGAR